MRLLRFRFTIRFLLFAIATSAGLLLAARAVVAWIIAPIPYFPCSKPKRVMQLLIENETDHPPPSLRKATPGTDGP
jgi:hypothetical protein